ncbi:MAG: OmpA family protein [bacterium]|nr:OmpA family protein [bacterium]
MRNMRFPVLFVVVCLTLASPAGATEPVVQLHDVTFPEKTPVSLSFKATPIAPAANLGADVVYRKGQARIELSYEAIKPAILFGGDVTCFVVWAVTRDGKAENLGELLTRKKSGKVTLSTGKKHFAMMVTAESFYLAGQPSELVAFYSAPIKTDVVDSTLFEFTRFAPAPRHNMDAIAHLKWDSDVPLELLQARKAHELARKNDAEKHAAQIFSEADDALNGANEIATSAPKSRELLDQARLAVALSNEALNISLHRIEAIEVERKLAERRAETEALERRAAEAEAASVAAQQLAEDVRHQRELAQAEIQAMRAEKTRIESSMIVLQQEKTTLQDESLRLLQDKTSLESEAQRLLGERALLEQEATRLREEKASLETESKTLRREKSTLETASLRLASERDELRGRLQSALSHVADTTDSTRGLVVNLPDILFDVNDATLKTDIKIVLAKLAGILLISGSQSAMIEGHTDSTGDESHNLELSQRRANAVQEFLHAQGIEQGRLHAVGFGLQKPISDNDTPEGRSKNRRVEIVISETGDTVALNR